MPCREHLAKALLPSPALFRVIECESTQEPLQERKEGANETETALMECIENFVHKVTA